MLKVYWLQTWVHDTSLQVYPYCYTRLVSWIYVSKRWLISQLLRKKRQLIASSKTFSQVSRPRKCQRDDKVVEVEESEKEAVVECFTTPKKQKTTLLEKLLGKQFEDNQTTITVSENEIVQADISYYKSPSPSVKSWKSSSPIVTGKCWKTCLLAWKFIIWLTITSDSLTDTYLHDHDVASCAIV